MRTLNDYFISTSIADIDSASTQYTAVPDSGRIVAIYATINEAKTSTATVLTLKTVSSAGVSTAVTGGTLSIAAGDLGATYSADFGASDGTDNVTAGGGIEIESGGQGAGGGKTDIVLVIRR